MTASRNFHLGHEKLLEITVMLVQHFKRQLSVTFHGWTQHPAWRPRTVIQTCLAGPEVSCGAITRDSTGPPPETLLQVGLGCVLTDPRGARSAVLSSGPLSRVLSFRLNAGVSLRTQPRPAPTLPLLRRRTPCSALPWSKPQRVPRSSATTDVTSCGVAKESRCLGNILRSVVGGGRCTDTFSRCRSAVGSSEMLVRFGRRRDQAKETTKMENNEEDQVLYPPLLPSKVDLCQVTIIPNKEWKRIQDSLDSLTREAACLRAERRAKKEMHLRSQEVVKHWTNTYTGLKEQKLKAKKQRDAEIEAERQTLDIEEAIYKQGERKKAIENARQYQFYQTQRVKNFHSGLLLSRTMKERDAQIEFQKNKIKSDKKWEEQMKLNIEKAFKEEREEVEKRHRERVALANDQLKQIKEHEEERERKRKEEEKDAEEIRRQSLLYQIEMQRKVAKRKEEMHECRRLFLEHIHDKNILKAVKQQQQMEEDDKIRNFVKAKKRLAQMRKEKEAETHRLMEERRERIHNFLSELMKEKLDNEDVIIARDIAEAEAEREKREHELHTKKQAELKAIADHRATVMKNKEEEERQRKINAKEQLLDILKADQIFFEHEKKKKQQADKERRAIQDAHIQQMAKNKFNAKQSKEEEVNYYKLAEAIAAEKEKEFQNYAREVIESESQATKKYIYPLVKAVQEGPGGGRGPVFVDRCGLRPSYQVNDASGVQLPYYSSRGSKYNDFQKSKGRLGFTW
ncbi:cilia- and flagella- associated protein 210 [Rhynchocyon petersi]